MPGWSFAEVWTAIAREVPDRPAVICGDRTVTWGEFDERASRLASHLAAAGVQPGDRVALDLTNVPEYLEDAVRRAQDRCCAAERELPVPRRRGALRARQLRRPKALVHAPAYASVVAEAIAGLPDDARPGHPRDRRARTRRRSRPRRPPARGRTARPDGDDLILLYTGGTTGMPKGVMWRNDDLYVALWQSNRPGTLPKDPVEAVRAGKRAGTCRCPRAR